VLWKISSPGAERRWIAAPCWRETSVYEALSRRTTSIGNTASRTCPNGSRLIGGGALTTGDNGIIQASYPDPASASSGPDLDTKLDPTTWTAQGSLTGGSGFMQVYALCLDG
jgi:hypothetical protein